MALSQRRRALKIGNRVRIRRAEVRREIYSQPSVAQSRAMAAQVLANPEPACEGMSAYHLLISCRRVGARSVTSLLIRAGVPQHKRLVDLTDRQRAKLGELLEAHPGAGS